MTSSRRELDQMKKSLAKGNLEAFDHFREVIRERFGANKSCPFEAMEILGRKMPKGEAEEYSGLVYRASILSLKRANSSRK
jgi:hypothetical protein